MASRTLLLGPPGCGKTFSLLARMRDCLRSGIAPERIAFVSFTRGAVREARTRACEEFDLTPDRLPLFRTVHSLCYHQLGLRRSDVFGREGLAQLTMLTGEQLTGHNDLEAPTLGDRGDALLFLDQVARNTLRPLADVWHEHNSPIDWFRLKRFTDAYRALREDEGLLDFTDMLERFDYPVTADAAFVDEAQDLTPLQWRVVDRAFRDVPQLVISADDDQAVHEWAGSTIKSLLDFKGTVEVLHQSHRLPRTVHALAQKVAGRITNRFPKEWNPTAREGRVEYWPDPERVDLSGGSWLLLARTRRGLTRLADIATYQGVVFSQSGVSSVDAEHVEAIKGWEAWRAGGALPAAVCSLVLRTAKRRTPRALDSQPEWTAADLGIDTGEIWHDALRGISLERREYYLTCLRRGESLTKPPRVRIETIHGAKGAEADSVLLMTDINKRVEDSMRVNPDAEERVWYVGVTRAREALYIVEPQGRYGYSL